MPEVEWQSRESQRQGNDVGGEGRRLRVREAGEREGSRRSRNKGKQVIRCEQRGIPVRLVRRVL